MPLERGFLDEIVRRQIEADMIAGARGADAELYVRYDSEIRVGDTLCVTCGRAAVLATWGEPDCPECAA